MGKNKKVNTKFRGHSKRDFMTAPWWLTKHCIRIFSWKKAPSRLALTLEAEWGRLACKIVSISPVFPFFHLFCHGSPGLFEMFGDRKLSSQQPKGRFGHMNTTEKHSFCFGLAGNANLACLWYVHCTSYIVHRRSCIEGDNLNICSNQTQWSRNTK